MARFYLNGEPIEKIPEEVKAIWSERLSKVVSRYFSQHPDEYERYLESLKEEASAEAVV